MMTAIRQEVKTMTPGEHLYTDIFKALNKDHHALRTWGSSESHQVLEDEREALVCVDDVV